MRSCCPATYSNSKNYVHLSVIIVMTLSEICESTGEWSFAHMEGREGWDQATVSGEKEEKNDSQPNNQYHILAVKMDRPKGGSNLRALQHQ